MLAVCRQEAPDASARNALSSKISRLKCLVTGQQDLSPPSSTPAAPSEAPSQLVPTEGAAASEQVAQGNLENLQLQLIPAKPSIAQP